MNKPLVDFLNHGLLPFVGRQHELERLDEFRRLTLDGEELRAVLITGEAGIGKSRLADEVIGRAALDGGIAVRVRLYPESMTSLAPLLASALWDNRSGRRLLGGRPEETVSGATGALRRLARLRPMLLVVEDVHLLAGQPLAEFASVLNALADEVLSLLCLARPIELPARGVLEPYLAETLELHGLSSAELDGLWKQVFGENADASEIDLLRDATGGNTLAIRSALRGAVKAGVIGEGKGEGGRVTFESILRHNVGLLSKGMAVHLEEDERVAAGQLATLGEVFAAEAAEELAPEMGEMLGRLEFHGIIARSISPPMRLVGPASTQLPFAFTHTLLHRHLLEQATPDAVALLRVVAGNAPLYSLLPLSLLAGHSDQLSVPHEQVRAAIDRLVAIAVALYGSPDHERAHGVWELARQFGNCFMQDADDAEKREVEIVLVSAESRIHIARIGTDEYRPILDRLVQLTDDPLPESLVPYRLNALRIRHGAGYRRHFPDSDEEARRECIDEIEGFIQQHPSLRFTDDYLLYLVSMAQAATADEAMQRWIERDLQSILADPDADEEFRARAAERVGSFLLNNFWTPEDAEEKKKLLERIAPAAERDLPVLYRTFQFQVEIGRYDREMARRIERAISRFRDQDLLPQAYSLELLLLRIRAAAGEDLDTIMADAWQIIERAPERIIAPFRRFAGPHLLWIALLRGDRVQGRTIVDAFGEEMAPSPYELVLLAGDAEVDDAARTIVEQVVETDAETENHLLRHLALMIADTRADRDAAVSSTASFLRAPIPRAYNALLKRALLRLIERIGSDDAPFAKNLTADVRFALDDMLEWFAAHEAVAFMQPVLEHHGAWLPAKELKAWQSRAATIARKRRAEAEAETGSGGRLRLTMLGQVEVHPSEDEAIAIRGGRLRTVLGLLVADRMLRKPLGHREFCYIAAGSDDDLEPENARKTMNNAIFRLRELLGDDVISTEGETPQLNPACVYVDLLEAYELLGQAERDARDDALMRAVPSLRRALELSHGEVPFPSLYEDFFEALREDFENRLRSAAVDVAARLLRAGDASGAEELLRPALEAIPEDEELAEMLREALMKLGRRAEAARMKISEAVADL